MDTYFQGAKLAQPDFKSGEAQFLLNKYVPEGAADTNNVWLGAQRTGNGATDWNYLQQPSPQPFTDADINPWGKRQPDDKTTPDKCQCGLAMAQLNTWPSKGFHDAVLDEEAGALCEMPLP